MQLSAIKQTERLGKPGLLDLGPQRSYTKIPHRP
jgi:hypothetical protein